jgi:NAD+ diphosphatase
MCLVIDCKGEERMSESHGWRLLERYEPSYQPPLDKAALATHVPEPDTIWFFFEGDRILVIADDVGAEETAVVGFAAGSIRLPQGGTPSNWAHGVVRVHPLGRFCGHTCCAVLVVPEPEPREPDVLMASVPQEMVPKETDSREPVPQAMVLRESATRDGVPPETVPQWLGLRDVLPRMDDDAGFLAGRALQILNWERNNRFCGRCGDRMAPRQDERAMRCPSCGFLQYPRLSPAVIVSVLRGDKLLLAHNNRFPKGRYSLLAGFVEPGETFEDCVEREIFEEVGIRVRNIRYLSSQPWPFPDSLMVGFTAEWEAGTLAPDGVEIADAQWFGREDMPEIPGPHTIAGKIIRGWLADT